MYNFKWSKLFAINVVETQGMVKFKWSELRTYGWIKHFVDLPEAQKELVVNRPFQSEANIPVFLHPESAQLAQDISEAMDGNNTNLKFWITFFEQFSSSWTEENGAWILNWDDEGVRKYYLYQVFLHELGHIFDKRSTSQTKREKYADSFARDMAEHLGER